MVDWPEARHFLFSWKGALWAFIAGAVAVIGWPKTLLEQWRWIRHEFFDLKVLNVLRDSGHRDIVSAHGRHITYFKSLSISEISNKSSVSEKGVAIRLERLRKNSEVVACDGGWKVPDKVV